MAELAQACGHNPVNRSREQERKHTRRGLTEYLKVAGLRMSWQRRSWWPCPPSRASGIWPAAGAYRPGRAPPPERARRLSLPIRCRPSPVERLLADATRQNVRRRRKGAGALRASGALGPGRRGRSGRAYVKVTKVHGSLAWHAHDNEDELFLVLSGRLRIEPLGGG